MRGGRSGPGALHGPRTQGTQRRHPCEARLDGTQVTRHIKPRSGALRPYGYQPPTGDTHVHTTHCL